MLAKQIMRAQIESLIGDKPLKSRELLIASRGQTLKDILLGVNIDHIATLRPGSRHVIS